MILSLPLTGFKGWLTAIIAAVPIPGSAGCQPAKRKTLRARCPRSQACPRPEPRAGFWHRSNP